MMGVLFTALLLLSQAGNASAYISDGLTGP
jgi:hypothetical protein